TSVCSAFLEKTITIHPDLRAEIEPSDTVGCSPFNVSFENDFTGVTDHTWYVISTNNGQRVSGSDVKTSDFTYNFENNTLDTIRFKVVYAGASAEGCPATDSSFVLIYPEIAPSFTA